MLKSYTSPYYYVSYTAYKTALDMLHVCFPISSCYVIAFGWPLRWLVLVYIVYSTWHLIKSRSSRRKTQLAVERKESNFDTTGMNRRRHKRRRITLSRPNLLLRSSRVTACIGISCYRCLKHRVFFLEIHMFLSKVR